EEATSGEHLPQDDPQGEDVDALVDRLLHHRLGREVAELALDDAGVALRELARRLREAEVHDLHLAVLRDEDVGGGDVAVDDLERLAVALELVGVGEALADAPGDVDGRLDRDGPGELARVVHHRLQIRAVDVLHDDEVRPVTDADVEDADDVGMREVRGEARLVEEHGDELLFLAELRQDALDRDLLSEALDAGALGDEDLRHAAGRQALEDAVTLLLAHSIRLASAPLNLAPTGHLWRISLDRRPPRCIPPPSDGTDCPLLTRRQRRHLWAPVPGHPAAGAADHGGDAGAEPGERSRHRLLRLPAPARVVVRARRAGRFA